MKKVLMAAAVLALIAPPAMAWEQGNADNWQWETQNISVATGPGYMASEYTSDQYGMGGSWNGSEGQYQIEGAQGAYSYAGNTHYWDLASFTGGGSSFGLHFEGGYTDAYATGANNGYGSYGYGGSGLETDRWAWSLGNAGAYSGAKGYVAYKTVNNWYGASQEFDGFTSVDVGASTGGWGYGEVSAQASGGSAAVNSGWQSTNMAATSNSHSEIDHIGDAGGEISNYNHYTQATGNGLTYQYQEGFTYTHVSE